ncbi:hypothetical protein GWK53_30725 [Burkholderia cepacia]|uniref:transposase n=1 Tax=Burkholderia cepacia TaxID=292 RepID=UPI0013F45D5E|nr:transposase [Burkholderia cepacia]NHB10864.1 hypothetical protein [Burkholderia cepacia]
MALETPFWTETEFVDLDLGDARLNNEYVCPQGQALPYSTTIRVGYREYRSDAQISRRCSVRAQYTNSANAVKVGPAMSGSAPTSGGARRLIEWGQRVYARRKETMERSVADAKQLHGHRYARMRGLRKVAEQCLLAAMAQNIKKIAVLLARQRKKGPAGSRLAIRTRPAVPGMPFVQPIGLLASRNPPSRLLEKQNPTLRKTWGSSAVRADVWPAFPLETITTLHQSPDGIIANNMPMPPRHQTSNFTPCASGNCRL